MAGPKRKWRFVFHPIKGMTGERGKRVLKPYGLGDIDLRRVVTSFRGLPARGKTLSHHEVPEIFLRWVHGADDPFGEKEPVLQVCIGAGRRWEKGRQRGELVLGTVERRVIVQPGRREKRRKP